MLDATTIAALAASIADELEQRQVERSRWTTSEAVAAHLGVEREYVYQHAAELGAVRLGKGPKGRLRFRLDRVDELLAARAPCLAGRVSLKEQTPPVEPNRRPGRRPCIGTEVELLPIRGARAAR